METKIKKGNATRTKGQIRGSKSKGSQMEMDCEASLQQIYPDACRTHDRGFIKQYDIISEQGKIVCECKRLKGISWNQLEKFYQKLIMVSPLGFDTYLLFRSNNQPCLVMYQKLYSSNNCLSISKFEEIFGKSFIKHQPTKRINMNKKPNIRTRVFFPEPNQKEIIDTNQVKR